MAKKDKKRIGVAGALMWRITALTMALWLMAMGTITWLGPVRPGISSGPSSRWL